ncbi:MAG TPA: hypothetical protein VGH74_04070 [Planctomycetaceae bacterium]|jgi:hypothetical protein
MRETEKVQVWVVYEAVKGTDIGRKSLCQQSEWEAIESRHPGHNRLVQGGIMSESEAEKLARGTSGDAKKKGPKSDVP